jgi:hypothetical protein
METTTTTMLAGRETGRDARLDLAMSSIESARQEFLPRENVIGVGFGFKESGGRVQRDVPAILVYVLKKKDKAQLAAKELIPSSFGDLPTDVIQIKPGSSPAHDRFHGMWIDQGKIHDTNPDRDVFLEPRADQDVDDVAVLEIDNTFVNGSTIDFVKATKRFLLNHPDAFDFITFYVDTATGLPGQGSYHSGIYNKTTGINYYAGSSLDIRSTYGTQRLQAMLSIGWIGNSVLLQEFGHMWAAFVRNRDTQSGANRYDLLISQSGQGLFHWGRYFDNDHSPMDYDGIDWEALGTTQFQAHSIEDTRFHFCSLDMYLMGLVGPLQVSSFYVIQNPSGSAGTITGTRKNMTLQNVIWAEGARNPAYPGTQKIWKVAFVVLTKDASASRNFTQQVAQQRREFTWQAYKGTRFLGKVDTALAPTMGFPSVQQISVATDNDRAFVGWKTSVATKGRVNYSTSPNAFDRERAHTDPFSSVAESAFGTSHGVLLTGLTPNSTYYLEVVVETQAGLMDRAGPNPMYTRKTNDVAAPDINNVSLLLIGNTLLVKWKTDERSDSVVRYGKTTPPMLSRFDPYPTTEHAISLTGLASGTYYLSVGSRDAAGNLTVDDNGGAFYTATVPSAPLSAFATARVKDIAIELMAINSAVEEGDRSAAVHMVESLIGNVGEQELRTIASSEGRPADALEAAFDALGTLATRLGGALETMEVDSNHVDFAAVQNPLASFTCIHLPPETIEQSALLSLNEALAKLYPGVALEAHPSLRPNEYRLRR